MLQPVPGRAARRPPDPTPNVPDPAVPDRYADAVRARRTELRGVQSALPGHRAELRNGLAGARLAASAELGAALGTLERELRRHADHGDRAGRAALPGRGSAAVARLLDHVLDRWVAVVLPVVRGVATLRGVGVPVSWPGDRGDRVTAALGARPRVALPAPDPPSRVVRTLLTGATEGTWRLALLPVAVLSALGLPVVGLSVARSTAPLALVLGLVLVALAVRARGVAADRARLRRWSAEVTLAVRGTLETELARRLLEVERRVGAELDDAVSRRRAEIDAELRALAPEPEAVSR